MNEELKNEKEEKKNEKEIIKEIINNSKKIINKHIHLFLFNLFKYIFIKKTKKSKFEKSFDKYITKINENMIKEESKFISKEYNLNNIRNIIDFVKSQNTIYGGDIIESILIYIISFGFKIDKDLTFGEYIFSNIYKLKDIKNYDIVNMIKTEIFIPKELHDIKQLLITDSSFDDQSNMIINKDKGNLLLYYLLIEIHKIKYKYLWKNKYKNKSINYINGDFLNFKLYEHLYDLIKNKAVHLLEKDLTVNSIMGMVANIFFSGEFGIIIKTTIGIIRSFLISVFIYYQNKHSPLMNYIKPNKDIKEEENENSLAYIPFTYDVLGACIEGRFSNIILSPLKTEPRISNVLIGQNNFREIGIYELGKLLILNQNIEFIDCTRTLMRTNYLNYFTIGMGVYDNYTLEELNLSFNYLKEDCEENIYKIISHLKGLKTLNLSSNEFSRGLSSFFVVLRKLYRKGKCKLENLYLTKCMLNEQSLYELGELLKCKFCKLKKLFLSRNYFSLTKDFLKKLKKNKSLKVIYLNKNDILNNNVDDILRIINISQIRNLYLHKTQISDFNKFLSIISRTKLIKEKNDENSIIGDESFLTNLDLSNNNMNIKTSHHIEILTKLIEKTNLNCLDISHILYGPDPNKMKKIPQNLRYRAKVENLKNILEKDINKHIENVRNLNENKVDHKKNEYLKEEKILNHYDDKINEILKNERAKYTIFLKKEAKSLLNNDKNKEIIKSEEEYKKVKDNIVNYMIYKRSGNAISELEKEIKQKKLILI